jgi:hypothetical protein
MTRVAKFCVGFVGVSTGGSSIRKVFPLIDACDELAGTFGEISTVCELGRIASRLR